MLASLILFQLTPASPGPSITLPCRSDSRRMSAQQCETKSCVETFRCDQGPSYTIDRLACGATAFSLVWPPPP
jgi:hypothetical protein